MDTDVIKTELRAWLKLADRFQEIKFGPSSMDQEKQELAEELFDRHLTTLRIVRKVLNNPKLPALVTRRYPGLADFDYVLVVDGATVVRQALGSLERSAEVNKALGSAAPTLSADQLHPTVWETAASLWASGHHGMAVQRAATNLSGYVQDMVGRYDLNDTPLMQDALSSAPPKEGHPRLRWPGDPAALTNKAMNEGIRSFAVGCFLAIRNPLTHSVDEIPKQIALEQLSALSVLARWIDDCEKVEAE